MEHKKSKTEGKMSSNFSNGTCKSSNVTSILNNKKSDCEMQIGDKCPVSWRKRKSNRLLLAKRQANGFKRTLRSRSSDCDLLTNTNGGAKISSWDGRTENLKQQTSFEIKQAEDGSIMVVDKAESKWIYRSNTYLPQKLVCNDELLDRRRPIVVLIDVMEEKNNRSNNKVETNSNTYNQKTHQSSYLLPDGQNCNKNTMEPMLETATKSHIVESEHSLHLRKRKSKDNPIKFSLRIKKRKLEEMKGRSHEKSILRQYLSSCQNERMPTNLNFEDRFSKSCDSKNSRGFDQTRNQNVMRNRSHEDSLQTSVTKRDKSKSKGMYTTYSYIGVKDSQSYHLSKKTEKIRENTETTLKGDVDSRTANYKASRNVGKFHDSNSETEDYVLSESDDINDQEIYGIGDNSSDTSYRDINTESNHQYGVERDSMMKRYETRKSNENDMKEPFRTEDSAIRASTEVDIVKICLKIEEAEVGLGNVTNVKGISKTNDIDLKKYCSFHDQGNPLNLSCEIKENANTNKRAFRSKNLEFNNHVENKTKDSITYKAKDQTVEYTVKGLNVEHNIKDPKTEYKAKDSSAEYKTGNSEVEYKAKNLNAKYNTKDSKVEEETKNSKDEIKSKDSKIENNIKDSNAENKTKDSKIESETNDSKMEYKAIESNAENEPKGLKIGYKSKDSTTEYKAKDSEAECKWQDPKVEHNSKEPNAEYKGTDPNTKHSDVKNKQVNRKVRNTLPDWNAKDNYEDSKVEIETKDSRIGIKAKDSKIENKVKDSNAENKTKDPKVEHKVKDLNNEYKAKDTNVKNKTKNSKIESKTKDFKIEYKAIDSNDANETKDLKDGYKVKDSNAENKTEDSKVGYKTKDMQIEEEVIDKFKNTKVEFSKTSKEIENVLITPKTKNHKDTEPSKTAGYRSCENKPINKKSVSQTADHEIITNKKNLFNAATADHQIVKHKEKEDGKVLENMEKAFDSNSHESFKTVGYKVRRDHESFIEKTCSNDSFEKLKNNENLSESIIFTTDSGTRRSDGNNHEEISKTEMKNKKKNMKSEKEKSRVGTNLCKGEKRKSSKEKNRNTITNLDELEKALLNEKENTSNLKKSRAENQNVIANKAERRIAVNVSFIKEEKSNQKGTLQKCEHCEISFQTLTELKSHKKESHKKIKKNRKVLPKKEKVSGHKETLHTCQQCETSFEKLTELKAHRKTNHPNTCGKCGLVFFDKATRMQHFWTHFNHIFNCAQCDSKFISEKLYQNHLKSLTHAKVVACIAVKNRQMELERKEEELIQAVASIQESCAQGDRQLIEQERYHPFDSMPVLENYQSDVWQHQGNHCNTTLPSIGNFMNNDSMAFTWTAWINDTEDISSLQTANTDNNKVNLYHSMDSHVMYDGNAINYNSPNVVTYLDQNVGTPSNQETIETSCQKDLVQDGLDISICNSAVDLGQYPHDMASYRNNMGCHSNNLLQPQN